MFQINDAIFQTSDPVWHETHLLVDGEQPFAEPMSIMTDESPSTEKDYSILERIILKSGSILIRIGNGLVGRVDKPAQKPQTI